jgi:hypothetical protein
MGGMDARGWDGMTIAVVVPRYRSRYIQVRVFRYRHRHTVQESHTQF